MTAEVGLVGIPVAGERPGVRGGRRRALRRPADLQRDHGLARVVHRPHCARKGRRIAQRFDEERHGLGLAVIGEVLEVVGHVEHRGVAYGDEVGKTEAPQCGERNARGAAMGNDGEAAVSHPFGDARAVEGHALVHVDETEAVRPAQHDPGPRAESLQLALPRAPFLAELREPARKHHGGPQAVRGAFLECRGDLVSRHGEHRALGGLGQLSERHGTPAGPPLPARSGAPARCGRRSRSGAGSPRRCCRACSRAARRRRSRRSAARAKVKDVIREGPSSDGPAAGLVQPSPHSKPVNTV